MTPPFLLWWFRRGTFDIHIKSRAIFFAHRTSAPLDEYVKPPLLANVYFQTKHLHSLDKSVEFGVLIAIGQATKRFVHRRFNSAGTRTAGSRKRI